MHDPDEASSSRPSEPERGGAPPEGEGEAEGPPPAPPRRLDARAALGVFLVFVLAQIAGAAVVGLALGVGAASEGVSPDDTEALRAMQEEAAAPAALGSALAGALCVGLALGRFPGERMRERAPEGAGITAGPVGPLVTGLLAGVVVALAYLVLASRLAEAPDPQEMGPVTRMAATPGTPRLVVTVLALAVAPPVEEVLFRGLLLRGFTRSWGAPVAGGLVTGLFVLVHVPELAFFWPATFGVGGIALAALALRLHSGAVGPAIACHLAYNACMMGGLAASQA